MTIDIVLFDVTMLLMVNVFLFYSFKVQHKLLYIRKLLYRQLWMKKLLRILDYLGRDTPVTVKETVCFGMLVIGKVKVFVDDVKTISEEARGMALLANLMV